MNLRFPYRLAKARRPVVSLGGRWVRPQPIISVSVVGPSSTLAFDALLDTGADDTVFPEAVAGKLGVDLSAAPVGEASGVGLVLAAVRYAVVELRLTDGKEYRRWPA